MRHKCARCGACCYQSPVLKKKEIKRFKALDALDYDFMGRPFIKLVNGRCIFLKGRECSIYDIRPEVCRQYPSELREDGSCQPTMLAHEKQNVY